MPTFNKFFSLDNHSVKNKTRNSSTSNMRLFYLNAEVRADFDKKIKQYDNFQYYGLGLTGKTIKKYREEHEEISKIDLIKEHSRARRFYHDVSEDVTKAMNFFARQDYNTKLSNPAVWQAWEDKEANPDKKSKIRGLHQRWQKHGKFSHYSSDALLATATYLDQLEAYIGDAKKELEEEGSYLSESEYQQYFRYLNTTLRQVYDEKRALTWAMYARLELAHISADASYDDINVALENNLREIGIDLGVKRRIDRPSHGLNKETITRFYKYIQENNLAKGAKDVTAKEKLQSLEWFNNKATLPLKAVHYKKTIFFIPSFLEKVVPTKPRKPAWLFRGHNKRFYYFHTHQQLMIDLASQQNLPATQPTEVILFENYFWSKLIKQKSEVKELSHQAGIEASVSGWRRVFQKKTKSFFETWELELLNQQQTIVGKQIDFLSTVLPKASPIEHLLGERGYFLPETRLSILKMLNDLSADISRISSDLELKKSNLEIANLTQSPQYLFIQEQITKQNQLFQKFDKIDTDLKRLIAIDGNIDANNKEKSKAVMSLEILANGEAVSEAEVKQIITCHDNLMLYEAESADFIRDNGSLFEQMQTQLKNILCTRYVSSEKTTTSNNLVLAVQYTELLSNLAFQINDEMLLPALEQFLLNYEMFISHQTKEELLYPSRISFRC